MALKPNATYKLNGVTVNEKIIPDGTRWKDTSKAKAAGFSAGSLYKKQAKLNGTGKAKYITIHNTNDLGKVEDDSEQYTRATYNENMRSTRVHFYVDDLGAWQNLKAGTGLCPADKVNSAEVGWHAGDGSTADGGNMTSLALEIVMNDTAAHDKAAKDNGARIAAWLLWKNGLSVDRLVSHTYWVNKEAGKKFADVDEQCCNPIYGKKWCPTYIFASTDKTTAIKNWKAFKELVKSYLDVLNGPKETENATTSASGTIYRVQAGAFKNKSGAETYVKRLKAAGFDAIIIKSGSLYKVQVGAFSKKANASNMVKSLKAAGFDAIITPSTAASGIASGRSRNLQILTER